MTEAHWDGSALHTPLGSAVAEAVAGAAGLVLAVLGLAAVFPETLAGVATIAIGVALLAQGVAIAGCCTRMVSPSETNAVGAAALGGGTSAEFLAGGAGVVLGLLSLIGVEPVTLTAAAVITFGGALVLGSAGRLGAARPEEGAIASREVMQAASGAQVLVGLGAVALGIIALVGIAPETLALAALLSVGASVVLRGTGLPRLMAHVLHA